MYQIPINQCPILQVFLVLHRLILNLAQLDGWWQYGDSVVVVGGGSGEMVVEVTSGRVDGGNDRGGGNQWRDGGGGLSSYICACQYILKLNNYNAT